MCKLVLAAAKHQNLLQVAQQLCGFLWQARGRSAGGCVSCGAVRSIEEEAEAARRFQEKNAVCAAVRKQKSKTPSTKQVPQFEWPQLQALCYCSGGGAAAQTSRSENVTCDRARRVVPAEMRAPGAVQPQACKLNGFFTAANELA